MTRDEFDNSLADGKKLFGLIADKLNLTSQRYIRETLKFRRLEDFNEICLALSLFAEVIGMDDFDSIQSPPWDYYKHN